MMKRAIVVVCNFRGHTYTPLSHPSFIQVSHRRWFSTVPSHQQREKEYRFKAGVCSIPHPSKAKKGGEDAHFVSEDGKVIGVADGVGGWTGQGVDPALYSRGLMEGGKRFCDAVSKKNDSLKSNPNQNNTNNNNNTTTSTTPSSNNTPGGDGGTAMPSFIPHNPFTIMVAGWKYAVDIMGSSTCCICVLDGLNLKVCNMGDSGYIISRNGTLFYKSEPQQYKFNFPYQLGSPKHGHGDDPRKSQQLSNNLQEGDVVVAATDGVFDNVSAEVIVKIINSTNGSPADLAQKIGKYALSQGLKERGYTTPFAIEAKKHGLNFEGGKLDDITVVVGVVSSD